MGQTKVAVPAEVLAGLEAVRLSGRTNMFEVHAVIEVAFKMEHYATAMWVEEHESQYVRGVFHGFSADRGGDETCAD